MKNKVNQGLQVFEEAMSKWSQRPLSDLFTAADQSASGVAFDRLVVGDLTLALVICIVHKDNNPDATDASNTAEAQMGRRQPRSMLNNQSLAFLLNAPGALTSTITATLDDPKTTLYASLNPQQIQKLEADFLKQVSGVASEQLGFIPGKSS